MTEVETTVVAKHGSLVEALSAAQGEFPKFDKDKTANVRMKNGGTFSYSYSSLDSVLSACRPVLSKHGLAISWVFEAGERHGWVITRLLWGSETLESRLPAYGGNDMQSLGSAITYAKRYGLTGLIGVTAEEDDDGASAGTQAQQQKPATRAPAATPPASQEPAPADSKMLDGTTAQRSAIEVWKERIAKALKPEEMIDFINKASAYADLLNKPELCQQVWDACADWNKSREAAGEWSKEEASLVRQWLMQTVEAWDKKQQTAKETSENG